MIHVNQNKFVGIKSLKMVKNVMMEMMIMAMDVLPNAKFNKCS